MPLETLCQVVSRCELHRLVHTKATRNQEAPRESSPFPCQLRVPEHHPVMRRGRLVNDARSDGNLGQVFVGREARFGPLDLHRVPTFGHWLVGYVR